jgi:hypothetical protein
MIHFKFSSEGPLSFGFLGNRETRQGIFCNGNNRTRPKNHREHVNWEDGEIFVGSKGTRGKLFKGTEEHRPHLGTLKKDLKHHKHSSNTNHCSSFAS